MLAGLRFLVRSKPVVPFPERLGPHPDGAFLCARHHQTKGVSYALVRVLVLDQVLDCGLDPGAVRWATAASTGGGAGDPGGVSLAHRLVCAGPSSPCGSAAVGCEGRKGRRRGVP